MFLEIRRTRNEESIAVPPTISASNNRGKRSNLIADNGSSGARTQVDRIGLQLYTLRKEMTNDFEGTLERVAELGYKEMEFAGYYGRSAGEVRDLLDRLGLSSPASHISLDLIRNDLNKQIDIAAEIGQSYIVIPSVPAAERTLSDFEKHAETLNEVGQKCKEAGLTIVYHNHSFEFEAQGTGTGYELSLIHI